MLEEWVVKRRGLKLQALEKNARQELEREACIRQETYGRYNLTRQWCWCQKQLQGVAKSLARWAIPRVRLEGQSGPGGSTGAG